MTINVRNAEEFTKLMEEKDLRISKGIVSGILQNLVGRKKNIHVLEMIL